MKILRILLPILCLLSICIIACDNDTNQHPPQSKSTITDTCIVVKAGMTYHSIMKNNKIRNEEAQEVISSFKKLYSFNIGKQLQKDAKIHLVYGDTFFKIISVSIEQNKKTMTVVRSSNGKLTTK